ncbi:MAG: hypothetical protein WDM92_06355 [Caulobacteraceae bacterium]
MRLAKPMLDKALAGQTELTPWNVGLDAAPGADVTADNTALAVVGQGTLATRNIFRQATAPVSGMASGDLWVKNSVTPNVLYIYDQSSTTWVQASPTQAAQILYADGVTTIEALKPAGTGADQTSSHTAAAITGQGTLATRNIFRQATAPVSGMASQDLWVKNSVTPNVLYIYDQSSSTWVQSSPTQAAQILYADGVTTIEALKPAGAGADQTSSHTAAAITGQGALATKSQVGATDITQGTVLRPEHDPERRRRDRHDVRVGGPWRCDGRRRRLRGGDDRRLPS